jgi:predicted RND superfamily exporter protein
VAWLTRHRYIVLAAAVSLTALGGWGVAGLRLDSSLTALLPRDTPSVRRLAQVKEKAGGFGDLIVMVESPDPERSTAYVQSILPAVRALPWVDRASFAVDDRVFADNELLYIDLPDLQEIERRVDEYSREQKLRNSPFFLDVDDAPSPELDFSDIEARYRARLQRRTRNTNEDGSILLLVIYPQGLTSNIGFARSIYADLEEVVEASNPRAFHPEMRVHIGGTYRNRLDEYDTIITDVKSGALWAGLGVVLLLALYFRRRGSILVIALPLGMSLVWTFALTRAAIGSLNLITAFLAIILFGLGIDFGIHMLTRYLAAQRSGEDRQQALTTMISRSGRASFTAATTTASAFYVLMFSDFLGFRHFGFIAGTGILLALAAFLVVFPALLVVAEDVRIISREPRVWMWAVRLWSRGGRRLANAKDALGAGPGSASRSRRRAAVLVLAGVGLISMASAAAAPGVDFEYDFRNLRSQVQRTRDFNRKMREVFPDARDPAVVMVASASEAAEVVRYVRQEIMARPRGPVTDVKSLASFLPADQDEKIAIVARLRRWVDANEEMIAKSEGARGLRDLRHRLDVSPVAAADLPPGVTRPFTGLPELPGQLVYLYQRQSLLDLRAAREFANAVGVMSIGGRDYHSVSEPIIYVELMELLQHDAGIGVVVALATLFLLVFMDLQSIRGTSMVLAPLLVGVLWMLGGMGTYGLDLSIFNMVVLPSILGLGVDAAVHIYHSYGEHGAAGIRATLLETGGASFVSTATTMIGFGGMVTALHPGLRSIGTLAILGLATCLLASLTLLPALLVVTSRVEGGDAPT